MEKQKRAMIWVIIRGELVSGREVHRAMEREQETKNKQ